MEHAAPALWRSIVVRRDCLVWQHVPAFLHWLAAMAERWPAGAVRELDLFFLIQEEPFKAALLSLIHISQGIVR